MSPTPHVAPDGAQIGAFTLTFRIVSIAFFTFICYLAIGLPLAVLPGYVHDQLGYGSVLAGLAISVQYAATLLSRSHAGRMADTVGPKQTVVIGMAACAASGVFLLLAYAFERSAWLSLATIIASRLALGFGESWVGTGSATWAIARVGPLHTARVISWNGICTYGGLALGSFLWGHFAGTLGVQGALLAAGCLLLVSVALLYNSRLPELNPGSIARAPSTLPGEPTFVFDTQRGSVLVTIEYRIPAERTRDFVRAAKALRRLRLRNGAERWALYRDISDKEAWQEVFLVDNWIAHLRMLDRMTLEDKTIIDTVTSLHAGDAPPKMRHGVSYESGSYEAPPETLG